MTKRDIAKPREEFTAEKLDRLETMLRARGEATVKAIGHLMKPEEVALETLAANATRSLRAENARLREALIEMCDEFEDATYDKTDGSQSDTRKQLIIRCRRSALSDAGWVVVPRVPTEEMIEAAKDESANDPRMDDGVVTGLYAAMLSALPPSPAPMVEMEPNVPRSGPPGIYNEPKRENSITRNEVPRQKPYEGENEGKE